MRKYIWIPLLLVLLTGCRNDKKKNSVPAPPPAESPVAASVDSLTMSETISFPETETWMDIDLNIGYIRDGLGDEAREAVNSSILSAAFGDGAAGKTFTEASDSLYRSLLFAASEGEIEGPNELCLEGGFGEPYADYLCYKLYRYDYSGGAHGNGTTRCFVFDGRSGAIVSESAFFKDGAKKKLSKLLTFAFMEYIGENDLLEGSFDNDISPNGNFTLSEKGVTWLYNPYEIALATEDEISLTIPWEKLKDLVRE